MRASRVIAGVLIFALEGPKRPWWTAPALMIIPIFVEAARATGWRLPFWAASPWLWLGCAVVGLWWSCTRLVQYGHYQAIARDARYDRCPKCDYDLASITSRVCPECGTNADEYLQRVREATNYKEWESEV